MEKRGKCQLNWLDKSIYYLSGVVDSLELIWMVWWYVVEYCWMVRDDCDVFGVLKASPYLVPHNE